MRRGSVKPMANYPGPHKAPGRVLSLSTERIAMATERTLPMQIVEVHAEGLVTAMDVVGALKKAVGAPDWHGDSVDASLDSMIYHDDINALKAPYTIVIRGAAQAGPEARHEISLLAQSINEHAAADRGGDLEVTILVEASN
jgi:hypothetical protein